LVPVGLRQGNVAGGTFSVQNRLYTVECEIAFVINPNGGRLAPHNNAQLPERK